MARSRLSILSNAGPGDLRTEPYPHLVIKNALDPELFAELNSQFPGPDVVMNGRKKADTWYSYPACESVENPMISAKWKEFLEYHASRDFYLDFLDIFADQVQENFPNLDRTFHKNLEDYAVDMRRRGDVSNPANLASDVSLEAQFYVNLSEKPREVRGPHVDRPTELFAALLYFRQSDDDSSGGNLEICEAKDETKLYPTTNSIRADHLPMEIDRDRVNITDIAEYAGNTLVMFLNTHKSLHSVSNRSPTPIPRRHINFTADLFNLPAPGLFVVRLPASKRMKNWLRDKPVAWRLASLIDD